ncbi:MAG TPA: hypothetical protein VNN10_05565 [Dehalococcoidia bacterium]|nr:hypothetical protein [Dehalococcoidia bacterium]
MCCRTHVYPIHLEVAASILSTGQFRPLYYRAGSQIAITWERAVPEEGIVVGAALTEDSLQLTISPAISTFADHFGKRVGAGIYFEIAARYAEKVAGEVIQRATVAGCRRDGHSQELVIARYPRYPLDFEKICAGFQAAILQDAA